ncbi:MAG: hypothetical protein ACOCT0_05415, partial [Halobacteriota archaeon]
MPGSPPDAERDALRVVVLFSGGASGLRYLAEHDPAYGEAYDVVGAFTDKPDAAGVDVARAHDVPVRSNDLEEFYAERDADTCDLDVRAEYDAETLEVIEDWDADVVLL